ncbi:MAG TPA: retroviral-like aspartic protease family protein, partial [Candidatus Udaeobacter sp.]|nr:retroviral-like aspartic protease family protein [Candidatus Udaeobacter sp.]
RFVLALLLIVPSSTLASVKGKPTQLSGYKAVRVHYTPLNKMIMPVRINGRRANLLVDTGSNQIILNAAAAASFGVQTSQGGLPYIQQTQINGQSLPVGFAQSLIAGGMSFGSTPVTLRKSSHSDTGGTPIDGVLGLDVLTRHKAVINCRTKLIFFKVDQARQVDLSSVASEEKFTRIPLRREENGALTVPCSIRGQPARLFVDTGAFLTILHEPFLKSVGVPIETTRISAHFALGASRKISAGKINDLKIGGFKAPPEKFGVTALPNFTLRQGSARVSGILGMDTLYDCHGIIDLDSMNLFLK